MMCQLILSQTVAFEVVTKYTFLGVSYRKGINLERQSTGKEAMLVAAVEEEAITRSVELLSDRSP